MADLGLLILRVTVGWVVLQHGLMKLGIGGRGSVSAMGQWFDSLGMRPGIFWAVVATAAETVGSILTIVGLGGALAPAIVAGDMLVVTFVAHWPQGFWVGGGKAGWEFTMPIAAGALAVALTGVGGWSIDALLGLIYPSWWATASVVLGLAGAVLALAIRAILAPKPQQQSAA